MEAVSPADVVNAYVLSKETPESGETATPKALPIAEPSPSEVGDADVLREGTSESGERAAGPTGAPGCPIALAKEPDPPKAPEAVEEPEFPPPHPAVIATNSIAMDQDCSLLTFPGLCIWQFLFSIQIKTRR
jgi:hypothetical protein